MAVAARAMSQATGRPHPIALSTNFLAPGRPGPVTITCRITKEGRRFTIVEAAVVAEGKTIISVSGTFGEYTTGVATRVEAAPPELPDPADCLTMVPGDPFPPPLVNKIELRLPPDSPMFTGAGVVGPPTLTGWFRLRDGEANSPWSAVMATDSFPPVGFVADLPMTWLPTIQMTVHLRRSPADGWLASKSFSRFITGGMMEQDSEIWDSTGELVAHARQLMLLPAS